MNAMDLCEALGDVREEYLREAQAVRELSGARAKAGRKRKRLVLLAACVCLVLASATVLASGGFGIRVLERFTDRQLAADLSESGYDLSVEIQRIPADALKGEVREAGAEIVRQYREYEPYSSWFPGHWRRTFSSRAEGAGYIGLDGLKQPELDAEEQETEVNVFGDAGGAIRSLTLDTAYTAGDIRLQCSARIYTEDYTEDITAGVRTTESAVYTESFYTTESGLPCQILISSALESGYAGMDGYLADGGVLYCLHIAYLEADARRARELLCQWAGGF